MPIVPQARPAPGQNPEATALSPTLPADLAPDALRDLIARRVRPAPSAEPMRDWRRRRVSGGEGRPMGELFARPPVPAAVLVPIVERSDGLGVLLTQRSSTLPHHPGQISFPGGRLEPGDPDAVAAALRETEEEIGLDRSWVSVAGFLPDHLIPVSGYRVTPVVSFVRTGYELRLDPTEVDEVFEVPLGHFLDPANHVPRVREYAGESVEFVDMPFGERNIWGATAGMLYTLYRLLRGEELAA